MRRILAALLIFSPNLATATQGSVDAPAVLRRVTRAEVQFLTAWRQAWMATMDETRREGVSHSLPRFHDTTATYVADSLLSRALLARWSAHLCIRVDKWSWSPHYVQSRYGPRGMCPIWLPRDAGQPPDISTLRDSAISPQRLPAIRAERAKLISLLDSASAALPENAFLIGQRVRFLLDQGDVSLIRADSRARVQGEPLVVWCADRFGIQHEGRRYCGRFCIQRCHRCHRWTRSLPMVHVSPLLDSAASVAFATLTCAQRDSLSQRLWWAVRSAVE